MDGWRGEKSPEEVILAPPNAEVLPGEVPEVKPALEFNSVPDERGESTGVPACCGECGECGVELGDGGVIAEPEVESVLLRVGCARAGLGAASAGLRAELELGESAGFKYSEPAGALVASSAGLALLGGVEEYPLDRPGFEAGLEARAGLFI